MFAAQVLVLAVSSGGGTITVTVGNGNVGQMQIQMLPAIGPHGVSPTGRQEGQ